MQRARHIWDFARWQDQASSFSWDELLLDPDKLVESGKQKTL